MKARQIFTFLCSLVIGGMLFPRPAAAVSLTVVISEVQTQSAQSATEEFIELYNATFAPVDVTGWKVEYISAGNTLPGSVLATLDGRIAPQGFVLLGKPNYVTQADYYFDKGLSETGGHIRVINAIGEEVDRLGWGAASAPEAIAASPAPKGKSLRREADSTALFKDTDNNQADFKADLSAPMGGGILPSDEQLSSTCGGVVMTEVLANPAGADTDGGEFIELYNPTTEVILLHGCTIATDKMTATALPTVSLAPNGYYVAALKDKLLNSGGKVTLTTASGEESVSYPELGDNEAWALLGADWKLTLQPTPGATNVLTEKAEEISGQRLGENDVTICPQGKYRNPSTNRCKNIEPAEVVAPCKPGQTRNPETNRCRTVGATAGGAVVCAPGQERNPSTNRCRKVTTTTSGAPKPCPAGQERNQSTGRCRKVMAATPARANEPSASHAGDKLNLGIMALAGTAALSYGAFEYRTEMRNWAGKLKAKLPFTSSRA